MVKPSSLKSFIDEVIEQFGFLLAQRISTSPLTPKDTTRMAKSFRSTYKFEKGSKGPKLTFTTPFYTKYVHEGTVKMKARPFINQIVHKDGEELLKKAFQIVDKRWRNK